MSQRMIQAAQARSPNGILARAWMARGQALDESPGDRLFVAMLAAYRASGGVARLDTLTRVPPQSGDLSIPSVLQRVSEGSVFSFDWRQVFWVPMFQFASPELVPKAALQQVLIELGGVFDGWTLATWFSSPNCWLKNERPVDLLDAQTQQVVAAARVDRFIATG